jgi:hypothetical protein
MGARFQAEAWAIQFARRQGCQPAELLSAQLWVWLSKRYGFEAMLLGEGWEVVGQTAKGGGGEDGAGSGEWVRSVAEAVHLALKSGGLSSPYTYQQATGAGKSPRNCGVEIGRSGPRPAH